MLLIVGLGNPGNAYSKTRHNLGFMVIDALSHKFSIPIYHKSKHYLYGRGTIEGKEVILAKPLTFMNRSGLAVKDLLRKFKDIKGLIVIHDDLDLNTGTIKIKKGGSSGGHKGAESIIEHTGINDFIRLRLGIGRSEFLQPEEYVLRNFSRQEQPLIKKNIEKAVDAIIAIIDKGIAHAQNKFHGK
ncbi:MAG: aminoacyl-tRNA hydrolase [Nitrospirae bacterium]|nr:aminoacyl-tRNA hydrolase [Nitrospirota bacterium]